MWICLGEHDSLADFMNGYGGGGGEAVHGILCGGSPLCSVFTYVDPDLTSTRPLCVKCSLIPPIRTNGDDLI